MKTLIYAHRGASGSYPENTLKAFEQAAKAGADGIEFDVQLTKDDVPVVIHDRTVNRTTNGQGPVCQYMANELKQLNAAAKQTYQKQESIPFLSELLDWAASYPSLHLNLEIKGYGQPHERVIDAILPLIHDNRFKERLVVSSFDHMLLAKLQAHLPFIETAALVKGPLFKATSYLKQLGAKGYHLDSMYVSKELIEEMKQANIAVRAFTVNDTTTLKKLFSWGCPAVFTDFPTRALHLREEFM
ncbi:glycerophosphodiester phosphodiesterase family protein [Shouchella clausii]|uniref:Glycerophosphoryl diester phosphodiesterase n=5 Tax=Shouchella TaxID=2893057 RepID=Q5WHX6_SHOC1|nr:MULTISPECIES: glycerophosphodiester phosphodiesterase family protein [Shouchella]ALA51360.1 Glycerophosphoryl diester phosphodiesterase [Shouchella clausii]KKI88150.1 hypothetical protein WZ76_01705 [Shouchella clausii]MBU3232770.1 glycerophosphodiester phosphodiesterase [Shouchella clausii]MBU3265667.1 glycerophosphodiester phosphodiesterase [Shouchella clausii]MBU3508504.1 glycerophosphodiester phosphodiesterase [Shouchella clausii]